MMQRVAGTILIFTLPLAACTSIQSAPAPERYIPAEKPSRVWITLHDSSVIVVDGPKLQGDTVNGSVGGVYTDRVALLSDVSHMQARRMAPAKTAAVATVVFGGLLGALYLLKQLAEGADRTTP